MINTLKKYILHCQWAVGNLRTQLSSLMESKGKWNTQILKTWLGFNVCLYYHYDNKTFLKIYHHGNMAIHMH